MATYETANHDRLIYVPMWGPPSKDATGFAFTNVDAPNGSIMAYQVTLNGDAVALRPRWVSQDMHVPDVPVVANGVVYAVQTGEQTVQNPEAENQPKQDVLSRAKFRSTPVSNLVLFALDAETGRRLYSSGNLIRGWAHFSSPVVALGKVFVASHDGRIYAFGLK